MARGMASHGICSIAAVMQAVTRRYCPGALHASFRPPARRAALTRASRRALVLIRKTVGGEPCFTPVKARCEAPALREENQIMGRPLLPADQLRRKVETYLTPAEREEILAKAQEARLSLATFIRSAAPATAFIPCL